MCVRQRWLRRPIEGHIRLRVSCSDGHLILQRQFRERRVRGSLDGYVRVSVSPPVLVHKGTHLLAAARLVALLRRMDTVLPQGAARRRQHPGVVDGLCGGDAAGGRGSRRHVQVPVAGGRARRRDETETEQTDSHGPEETAIARDSTITCTSSSEFAPLPIPQEPKSFSRK